LEHVEPQVEHEGVNTRTRRQAMGRDTTAVIGLDVHKDSVDIAIADGKEARVFGRVGGEAAAVDRVVRKIRSVHRDSLFVYGRGRAGSGCTAGFERRA
jgi:hypothetical protein